ncbi:hypothetical protein [Cellulomonas pakistanensis]|uniref:Uncharacterized protein n=1 Tax=Cellulomonas pakistanensis TaxID=992287 RepID=A0A919U1B6_9CELL|nr:hypothetical protein [Cellulomonas pakistanensis]GIG34703.1 hypothetical protein Cpa01nite_00840 [Cellulomonas pakistanensis]
MTEHRPTGPTTGPAAGPSAERAAAPDDDLAARVTAALRSREPAPAATSAAADRIAACVAASAAEDRPRAVVRALPASRVGRIAAAGVVTSTLAVVGAGAAAAANPYSGFAVAVEGAARAVGVDWSAMPAGYTRDQYETFWDAGYTTDDVAALEDLWQTDATTAKARAGQLLLDGGTVPVAPGEAGPGDGSAPDPYTAFFDAGFGYADAERLAELWRVDPAEAKARAGQLVIDGQPVPGAPSEG